MTELIEWQEKLELCGRCGNCQQVCPLYKEEKSELAVARGKLHLIALFLEGKIKATPRLKELFNYCLQCGRCSDLCQNGVPADKLIALGRAAMNETLGGGLKTKLIHEMLGKDRLEPSVRTLAVIEKKGLKKVLQAAGKINQTCNQYSRLLPDVKKEPVLKKLPGRLSGREGKPRIGYFVGCMNNYVSQDVSLATLNIFKKAGITVIIPEQKCCGLPAWTSGEIQIAKELVSFNMQAFQEAQVDFIVTDCASCGHALKELPEILLGNEGAAFSKKILDLSEFIKRYISNEQFGSLTANVTFHDPCHLKYGQKIKREPREILTSIPGLEFKEMSNSGCCGFAGTFALSHFDMSNRLARQRADAIKENGSEIVVTSCPACQLQLERICHEDGQEVKVLNLAQIVDKALLDYDAEEV